MKTKPDLAALSVGLPPGWVAMFEHDAAKCVYSIYYGNPDTKVKRGGVCVVGVLRFLAAQGSAGGHCLCGSSSCCMHCSCVTNLIKHTPRWRNMVAARRSRLCQAAGPCSSSTHLRPGEPAGELGQGGGSTCGPGGQFACTCIPAQLTVCCCCPFLCAPQETSWDRP